MAGRGGRRRGRLQNLNMACFKVSLGYFRKRLGKESLRKIGERDGHKCKNICGRDIYEGAKG